MTYPGTEPVSPNNPGGQARPLLLLAELAYGPAEQQTYNANTETVTPLDTVNLATPPFVVPPEGRVLVDVTADWAYGAGSGLAAATDMFLGLALHGTNGGTLVAALASWCGTTQPSFVAGGRSTKRYYCAQNLTPGELAVLDLVMGISSTNNISFAAFYAGDGGSLTSDPTGPVLVQVFG